MRLITRVLLAMMLILFTVPAIAQEETDFDPEADFTNTYTFETITLSHPDVVTVSETNFQIILAFDDAFRDYIAIVSPKAFGYFSIPNDTLDIAAQSMFFFSPGEFADDRTYEEAISVIEFAGYEGVITFERNVSGVKVVAYMLMIGEDIFAAILITEETVFPADVEIRVLERVLESMLVDDVSGVATPNVFAEATPDPLDMLASAEIRPAPVDDEAIELPSEIRLYDGEIRLTIPNTWVVVEDTYTVATSEVAADAVFSDITLDEGEIALQIISPDRMTELGIDEVSILTVTTTLQSLFPDAPIIAYEGLPYEAYLIPVTGIRVPAGAFFITFMVGENVADVGAIVGVTPDYDSAEGLIIAIINTIVYTPAETEE